MILAAELDGDFTLKAIGLALVVGQLITIWLGIVRGKQAERRSITFEGSPVDKAEFERHIQANEAQHKDIFHKLGGVERGVRAEMKGDMEIIRRDIKVVEQSVSGLTAATTLQNQALARIENKVDRRNA